ncbi:hypothetical protein PR048_000148 [Dryococelus australis]|uniref:Heparanase n=1 Tax=Dryococelus australis TaxID=614101 RepID=A0ABQ9IE04_9NEOP|nr:hypothetical protein PR048_000148 [Dryococelus australis]
MECNGPGNRRSPRKSADQRHRPARFPRADIRELPRRGSNPVRLSGRRGLYPLRQPRTHICLRGVCARAETRWQQLLRAVLLSSVVMAQVWGAPQQQRASVVFTLDSSSLSLVREASPLLLSLNLDSNYIVNGWIDKHIKDEKLLKLVSPLAPAYMRIGGPNSDKILFKETSSQEKRQHGGHVPRENWDYMTDKQWVLINEFTEKAGLKLMFSVNTLLRNGFSWNPDNAKLLLAFDHKRGLQHVNFGLGNEPDMFSCVFQKFIRRQNLAEGVVNLRHMLDSYPNSKSSIIIGPDTTDVPSSTWYLTGFLQFQNDTVNAVSIHHYYKKGGKAKLQDFYDPTIFNTLVPYIEEKQAIITNTSTTAPLWFGETGTTSDGGTANLTDRFLNGFLWLDKLGVAAKMGVQVMCRQGIYGHSNGLLNINNMDPNPDWWLSVLYKNLVGLGVFNTTIPTGSVRLYAHCSKTSPGSVVLFGMNLNSQEYDVNIKFNLTVLLNGKRLVLGFNYSLPSLEPTTVAATPLHLPAFSMAFFVLEDMKVSACKK